MDAPLFRLAKVKLGWLCRCILFCLSCVKVAVVPEYGLVQVVGVALGVLREDEREVEDVPAHRQHGRVAVAHARPGDGRLGVQLRLHHAHPVPKRLKGVPGFCRKASAKILLISKVD